MSQNYSDNNGNSDITYNASKSQYAQELEEIESSHNRAGNRPSHGVDYEGPPKDLEKIAKGTFNPLKPLLIYATRLPKKSKSWWWLT